MNEPSHDLHVRAPTRSTWEQRCVEGARNGNREAIAELYREFAPRLYRQILMPRLGHPQAAEDALAETFRVVLERLGDYEDQGKSIWNWLCRVAVNKANDMHRKKGRTHRALANFESLLAPLRESPERPDEMFQRRISSEKLASAVQQTLERINDRYRRVLELRFLEDLPRDHCAGLLEVKARTFDVLLLRALRAFRKEWQQTLFHLTEEVMESGAAR